MNRRPVNTRSSITIRGLLLTAALSILPMLMIFAAAPDWWAEQSVIDSGQTASDFSAINAGQLKNLARKAYTAMQARLPASVWTNTAGTNLTALVTGFSTNSPANYNAVNIGQVKAVAKPFYDVLISAGTQTNYPWTLSTNAPNDFAMANIGQAKNLFSFPLPGGGGSSFVDTDENGLDDAWEMEHFGHLGVDLEDDPDHDGLDNGTEYVLDTDPNDYYNAVAPVLTKVSGDWQDLGAVSDAFVSVPLLVLVKNGSGTPLVNAPVRFTVTGGSGFLAPDNTGSGPSVTTLDVQTDGDGHASVAYWQPASGSSTAQISAVPIAPSVFAGVTFHLGNPLPSGGLVLWLAADAGVNVDEFGTVTGWEDQSSESNHAIPTDFYSAPQTGGQIGSKPALHFDGFSALKVPNSTSLEPSGGVTVITVATKNGSRFAHQTVIGKPMNGTDYYSDSTPSYRLGFSLADSVDSDFNTSNEGNQPLGAVVAPLAGGNILTLTWDGSTQSVFRAGALAVSGAATGTLTYNSNPYNNLAIGGATTDSYFGDATLLQGDVGEIIVYNRALTPTERQAVEVYLADKYEIYHPDAAWVQALTPGVLEFVAAAGLNKAQADNYAARLAGTSMPPQKHLALWLAADTGVETSDGYVQSWQDQSAFHLNAVPANFGAPLLVGEALGGKPVIRFFGNESLTVPDHPILRPQTGLTVVAVASTIDPGSSQQVVSKYLNRNGGEGWAGEGPSWSLGFEAYGKVNGEITTDVPGEFFGHEFVATSGVDTAANGPVPRVMTMTLDGNSQTVTSAGQLIATAPNDEKIWYGEDTDYNDFPNTLAIGMATTGGYDTHDALRGDVSEILIYTRALTSTEQQQAEVYLADKYQIYHPLATWITTSGFSSAEQALIHANHFNKSQIDAYLTSVAAGGNTTAAGLVLWLRSDTGVETPDGGVAVWRDQSLFHNDVTQPEGSQQPTLVENALNGRPVVRFDGEDDYLRIPNNPLLRPTSGLTVIAVSRATIGSPGTIVGSARYPGGSPTTGYRLGSDAETAEQSILKIGSDPKTVTGPLGYPGTVQITAMTWDGATQKVFSGGSLTASATASGTLSNNIDALSIGVYSPWENEWLRGDVAEILIYNRALSDTERQGVEADLVARYGLYTPDAAWIAGFSSEAQSEIHAHHWNLDQANEFAVLQAANPAMPVEGLELWLKADAGIEADGDGYVDLWHDLTPNHNDARYEENLNDSRPQWVEAASHGQPSLNFTGDQALRVPHQRHLGPTEFTLIVVGRHDVPKALDAYVSKYSAGAHSTGYALVQEDANTVGAWTGNASQHVDTPAFAKMFATLTATYGSGTLGVATNNGASVSRAVTGSLVNGEPLCIGGQKYGSADAYLRGSISEVLFYRRVLTTAERAVIDTYLSEKYGLYRPGAAWISAYDPDVQAEINRLGWSKERADAYVAWLASEPSIPARGVALWLKADAGVTSDSGVSVWEDQSFNHNDASQPTSARRPALIENAVNDLPVVRFGGDPQVLSILDSPGLRTPKVTIIAIEKGAESSDAGQIVSKPYFANVWQTPFTSYQLGVTSSNELTSKLTTGIGTYTPATAAVSAGSSMHLVAAAFGNGEQSLYLDGSQVANTTIFGDVGYLPAISDLAIGSRSPSAPAESFSGDVAELIIYDHLLSPEEWEAVSAYATDKYGLAPVRTPVISPAGGDYTSDVTVSITTETAGAEIRYTTNGTEPTASSTLYGSTFNLSITTKVKAKAFLNGLSSATAEAIYWINDPSHTGLNPVPPPPPTGFQMPLVDIDFDPEEIFTPDDPEDPPQIYLFRPTNAVEVP